MLPEAPGVSRWLCFLMHEQVFSLWKNGTSQSFWCKLSFLEPCKGNLEAVWDGLCSGIDNLIVWSSADGGGPAQTQIRLGRTLYASPRGNITPTENKQLRGEHRSPGPEVASCLQPGPVHQRPRSSPSLQPRSCPTICKALGVSPMETSFLNTTLFK